MQVKLTEAAQADFKAIRKNVVSKFGSEVWKELNQNLQNAVKGIGQFPLSGTAVDELEEVGSGNYKQWAVNKRTRIIYEIRPDAVYVHIFMDTRMDLQTLLTNRLLS
jgi:plasmid stabilization system protein ParE